MQIFKALGVLLIVGLVGWIGAVFLLQIGRHPAPEVLGLGSGFEGNLQIPVETIKAVFEATRQKMLDVNDWGSKLRLGGDIAGWLSFAATAAITLIVGYHGRALSPAGAPANTEGLSIPNIRTIGFLAALAAVLTAFGSLAVSRSQDHYKRAEPRWDSERCESTMTGTSAIPELLGGENAPVAGDDHIVGADQHRVHEAEFSDRARDLRNLIARMRPRVADIGDQPRNRAGLDGEHDVSKRRIQVVLTISR